MQHTPDTPPRTHSDTVSPKLGCAAPQSQRQSSARLKELAAGSEQKKKKKWEKDICLYCCGPTMHCTEMKGISASRGCCVVRQLRLDDVGKRKEEEKQTKTKTKRCIPGKHSKRLVLAGSSRWQSTPLLSARKRHRSLRALYIMDMDFFPNSFFFFFYRKKF